MVEKGECVKLKEKLAVEIEELDEKREKQIRDRIEILFKERKFPIQAADVDISLLLDKIDVLREHIDHQYRLSVRDDEKIKNLQAANEKLKEIIASS